MYLQLQTFYNLAFFFSLGNFNSFRNSFSLYSSSFHHFGYLHSNIYFCSLSMLLTHFLCSHSAHNPLYLSIFLINILLSQSPLLHSFLSHPLSPRSRIRLIFLIVSFFLRYFLILFLLNPFESILYRSHLYFINSSILFDTKA